MTNPEYTEAEMLAKSPYLRAVEKVLIAGLWHFDDVENLDDCLRDTETLIHAMDNMEEDEREAWQKMHCPVGEKF